MTKREILDKLIDRINQLPEYRFTIGICWCLDVMHGELHYAHLDFLREISARVRGLSGAHGFLGYKWSLDKEGDRQRIEWIKSQPEYKF